MSDVGPKPERPPMSRQIRNLGVFFMVAYLALFIQMNRIAVLDADEVREDPRNRRALLRDFDGPRGSIVTADGELVAESLEIDDDDIGFDRQRVYPHGHLYGHITGYYSFVLGSTGLEQQYSDELAGRTFSTATLDSFFAQFTEADRVGNLMLTLRHDLQVRSQELLNGRNGSVVMLDARSGAVLAMYSNPTYDPNPLSSHDFTSAHRLINCLNNLDDSEIDESVREERRCPDDAGQEVGGMPLVRRDDRPLRGRAFEDHFVPGSTFKIVVASAGLLSGEVTADDPVYPEERCYEPPRTTSCIQNFGNNLCGGDLMTIIARSCNTSFMQMSVEQIGPELMVSTAERFGFNDRVPIDLPRVVPSTYPDVDHFEFNEPALALSSIGQGDVQATPLNMALVAAAVANGGSMPTPHVVDEVRDDDARLVEDVSPGSWRTAIADRSDVRVLYDAMVGTVEDGTASDLQLEGFEAGGKTGTAELGGGRGNHAWIIGFAGPEGDDPTIAFAVLVEAQPGATDQTGGSVAAPIAADLMRMALEPPAPADS
jgi:penicillin-binding protein A